MIVVTGASRGLGRAICDRLLSKNIEVLGLARRVEGIPFRSMSCDVSSYVEVKAVAQGVKERRRQGGWPRQRGRDRLHEFSGDHAAGCLAKYCEHQPAWHYLLLSCSSPRS